MAILLALVAAASYGAADFAGGLASRRVPVVPVVLAAQVTGLVLSAALIPVLGAFSPAGLYWGAAAGVFGGTGVALLYAGLARGRMSVVAPITGIGAALVPVLFDLARGSRPGVSAGPGIVLALAAVVLVSAVDEPGARVRGALLKQPGVAVATGSGIAFGLWFIALDGAPADSGLWPVLGTRTTSIAMFAAIALMRRAPVTRVGAVWTLVVAAGVLDIGANALYLLATRRGLLAIVAVVTSLYPASTVLLARIYLHERFGMRQRAGIACAAAGIALLALA